MPTFFSLLLRTTLAVCLGGFLWSYSGTAHAQSLTLAIAKVDRIKGSGGLPNRPNGLKTTDITRADCVANVIERFSLTVTGTVDSGRNLDVWASTGGDCTQITSRQNGTAGATCWQIAGNQTVRNGTIVVDIPAQTIASQLGNATKQPGVQTGSLDTCSSQPTVGASAINVYFLYGVPGNNSDSNVQQAINWDTKGPAGPTNVTAGDGDRVIVMKWSPQSSSGSDISGYTVYCAPKDGLDAAPPPVDAGDAGTHPECQDGGFTDGGVDDAGNPIPGQPIDGGCTQVPNVPDGGQPSDCPSPGLDAPIVRSVGSSVSDGTTVDGLTNGVEYACAVAAYDKGRNPGELSKAACAMPGPVKDFFWRYREAGGPAGGCALEGAPLTDGVMIGGATAAVLALVRRRRKGKRS
ncbi:fibronectin type III domain-containing protein [Pendulispora rubella]|uniref:Fibronectin type III domain-containing protein n=1 Tax=Pendulispora rubella TaxID=2741070 RepID=A0ABZ2L579_9BACT